MKVLLPRLKTSSGWKSLIFVEFETKHLQVLIYKTNLNLFLSTVIQPGKRTD